MQAVNHRGESVVSQKLKSAHSGRTVHPKTYRQFRLMDESMRISSSFNSPGKDVCQTMVDFHCDLVLRQKLSIRVPAGLHAPWQQVHGRAVYDLHKGISSWADTCTKSEPL